MITFFKYETAVKKHKPATANVTATLTPAQIKAGVIQSTSVAAVNLTTPTAAALVALFRGRKGTWYDLAIDNSAGASLVTIVGGTGVTAATAVVTGGATLTVAAGAVGLFRLYVQSPTAVKVYRLG